MSNKLPDEVEKLILSLTTDLDQRAILANFYRRVLEAKPQGGGVGEVAEKFAERLEQNDLMPEGVTEDDEGNPWPIRDAIKHDFIETVRAARLNAVPTREMAERVAAHLTCKHESNGWRTIWVDIHQMQHVADSLEAVGKGPDRNLYDDLVNDILAAMKGAAQAALGDKEVE